MVKESYIQIQELLFPDLLFLTQILERPKFESESLFH